jgi:5'-3' exonuclease
VPGEPRVMRVHLIDGTYELFRAHYSKRPGHTAPSGWDAKATVGVVQSFLALLADPQESVTHVAAAFDNPIRSFRNDLFDGYKTEEGVEPALLHQFDAVEEAVAAIGITVWSMDNYEADDALATGATRFRDQVGQVRILSPDKDLGQCIRGTQVVRVKRLDNSVLDEAGLKAEKGIAPGSVPDLLALTGDSADGIPGLDGFGEKSAATLLACYGKIEAIPEYPYQWKVKPRGADKLAATLKAERENALLYRKLATLVEDVPLKEKLADLEWRGVPRKKFEQWCEKIGASENLRSRPHRWDD